MHEWAVLMFQDEKERIVSERDGLACIKSLTTFLKNNDSIPGTMECNDALELCIDSIFDNSELNDDSNTRNVTNAIDNEATEEAYDDTNDMSRGKINSLSAIDMFEHANNELIKINVNQLRVNKNQRLQRSDDFHRDTHHAILNDDDQFDVE